MRVGSRVELLGVVASLCVLALVVAGCGDGDSEPEVRGPATGEGSVEAFCAPLLFDPQSADPAGDLVRRAVAVVDNSGTGADADAAAGSFVQNMENAPAEIREPAAVLGGAVSDTLSSGDDASIETPEVERAIADINAWAAANCSSAPADSSPADSSPADSSPAG